MSERGEFVLHIQGGWIKFICDSQLIAELLKVFNVTIQF